MEIRTTLLPPDLQYCLDCASQCCGITEAAEIAIRLYGEASRLDEIWNGEPQTKRWASDRINRELEVERYGAEIIAQLPGPRRMALMERGILSLVHDVITKTEWLSDCHYEDMTKGGCFRPFLHPPRLERNMLPTPKVARRLRSREAIKRYVVAEFDEAWKQREMLKIITSIPLDGSATDQDRDAVFRDLNGQMDSHARAARMAAESAAWAARFAENPTEQIDRVLVTLKPEVRDKIRKERKLRRHAVKRAAMLAAAVLGTSTVSAFARGEPVMLSGPDVSISARLSGSIAQSGHGALAIGVHQPDGTKLAGVCVYQDAPALDQLVSLAMHVRSGSVEDILTTGNLYAIEPAGDAHPVIAAHRGAREQIIPDEGRALLHRIQREGIRVDGEAFDAGKQAYIKEMGPVYEEIIATMIFGKAVPLWRRLRATIRFGEK